jgi:ankyrin repeat protein
MARTISAADGTIWDRSEYASNVIYGISHKSNSFLFTSARNGDVSEFIEAITLAPNMDVNARDDSGTPLIHLAILSGSDVLVAIIAKLNGVDLSAPDPAGLTPLMATAKVRDGKMASILLDTGKVDANGTGKGGDTALHIAAAAGAGGVVKRIIAKGGDTQRRNANGKTPADIARAAGMHDIAYILG